MVKPGQCLLDFLGTSCIQGPKARGLLDKLCEGEIMDYNLQTARQIVLIMAWRRSRQKGLLGHTTHRRGKLGNQEQTNSLSYYVQENKSLCAVFINKWDCTKKCTWLIPSISPSNRNNFARPQILGPSWGLMSTEGLPFPHIMCRLTKGKLSILTKRHEAP